MATPGAHTFFCDGLFEGSAHSVSLPRISILAPPGASAKNRGTGFVFILNAPSLLFGGGGLLLRDGIAHGSGCSRTGCGLVVSVLGPSPPRTRFLVDVFLFCLLLYAGTVRGSP